MEFKKNMIMRSEAQVVKKLGPLATYFSLLKGFIAIGILYMPKNCRNGGWLFTLFVMLFSFFVTYYSILKLLQARDKAPPGSSFAEIASHAIGLKGKLVVDIFLCLMQYGFVISFTYFVLESMKSVVDEIFDIEINVIYIGRMPLLLSLIGLFAFAVTAPLQLVRRIEKFAFTFLIADLLILTTVITIVVYAIKHLNEKGEWGTGVVALNTSTWLTVIGSAIYSFEGIGVVMPIIEVTENPKQFPKIVLCVLLTNMILYTGFGEFCLFVWGDEIEGKPLITQNLP